MPSAFVDVDLLVVAMVSSDTIAFIINVYGMIQAHLDARAAPGGALTIAGRSWAIASATRAITALYLLAISLGFLFDPTADPDSRFIFWVILMHLLLSVILILVGFWLERQRAAIIRSRTP